MAFAVCRVMSAADILVRNASGEDLWIASMVYNASISALEIRAYRPEGTPPSLVEKVGKGPLRIFESAETISRVDSGEHQSVGRRERGEVLRATIHFETATLGFGFECDPGARDRNGNPLRDTTAVREVVILRGLRIEQ